MAGEAFNLRFLSDFRLSPEQRAELTKRLDLRKVPESLFEQFENIVISYQLAAGRPPYPTRAKTAAALSRLTTHIGEVLADLQDPIVQQSLHMSADLDCVSNPYELNRRQLLNWHAELEFLRDLKLDHRGRGKPRDHRRRFLLIELRAWLDAARVGRDNQWDVMQFACELVGISMPEPSKLEKLLAVIPPA